MESLPQVLSVRSAGDGVELELAVPASLTWFPDHFPRLAMLPGVVQLDWAIRYGREHLRVDGAFRRVTGLKFLHPILPGARVTLALASGKAGEIVFAYRRGERPCSLGRVVFA